MNEVKRVITIDADEAVMQFNFVAGHVYFNDSDAMFHVPNSNGVQHYVADCWSIPKNDWEEGVRPADLKDQGELPVPVRAVDLGEPQGWLEDLTPSNAKKIGHKPSRIR